MKIVAVDKTLKSGLVTEVSEADLKAYLKHAWPLIHEMAWKQFIEEGCVSTHTTAYYDLDHEAIKEAMELHKRKEGV